MIPYPRDFPRFFEFSQRLRITATTATHARRPPATVPRPAARFPRTGRALAWAGAAPAPPAASESPPHPTFASPPDPSAQLSGHGRVRELHRSTRPKRLTDLESRAAAGSNRSR